MSDRGDLRALLDEHSDNYDSDCGNYYGCLCGWDEDVHDVAGHQADVLIAAGFQRTPDINLTRIGNSPPNPLDTGK